MKIKILSVLLALCLLAGLLPLSVLAENPNIKVNFSNVNEADRFSIEIAPNEIKYVVSNANKQFVNWTEAGVPTNNYVKLEYVSGGNATLKVTLNNIDADCTSGAYKAPCIEFTEGEYAVAMEVLGTNILTHGFSACIRNYNAGGLTITGAGNLTLNMGTAEKAGAADGALWASGGNLLIKNTTLNFNVYASMTSKHHAILSAKGNVSIEKAKINCMATSAGQLVYTGLATADVVRYSLDKSTDRFITIKDSEITTKTETTVLESATPVVISNSTLTATTNYTATKNPLMKPAPTLEGEYSAVAGLAKDADQAPWKLKVYNPKKLDSYTYFHMVPGTVDLIPPKPTEATEPDDNEPTDNKPTDNKPVDTKPVDTKPVDTKPVDSNNPDATTPDTTNPADTKPDTTSPSDSNIPGATEPDDADKDANKDTGKADDNEGKKDSDKTTRVILIILIALVVAGGAAVGVIFYLRNKNAAEEGEEEEAEEAEEETEAEKE